jgi:hypothetical protein
MASGMELVHYVPGARDRGHEPVGHDLDVLVRGRGPVTGPVGFLEESDEIAVALVPQPIQIDGRPELEALSSRAHLEVALPLDLVGRGAVTRELPPGLLLHAREGLLDAIGGVRPNRKKSRLPILALEVRRREARERRRAREGDG